MRHDWEVTAATRIYATLSKITLTYLEAQVLSWRIWNDAPRDKLADFLDVHPDEVAAAERSLLAKVAEAMKPIETRLFLEQGKTAPGRNASRKISQSDKGRTSDRVAAAIGIGSGLDFRHLN